MSNSTITQTSTRSSRGFGAFQSAPALLVAHAPRGCTTVDRCLVNHPFSVGRSSSSQLTIRDDKVSKRHFALTKSAGSWFIEDAGSKNGTYLNGGRLFGKEPLKSPALIRAGRSLLVFHADAGPILEAAPPNQLGMAGRFHTGPLIRELCEASDSTRHLLLTGPSGTGKELAARAVAAMRSQGKAPLDVIAHNAARFTSEEEATSTLFGVKKRVFSNVDERPGLIESANGGVLFIDEVHSLPPRIQQSLLRVIEDGEVTRIGDTEPRKVDLSFVFAANEPGPTYGLAHDFLARLRVVTVPSLADRVADIPVIFDTVLKNAFASRGGDASELLALLGGDHYEALCLDGFPKDNVRGLIDVADRLVTKIRTGTAPKEGLDAVFRERFSDGPISMRHLKEDHASSESSNYEQNKDAIIAAYRECGGNLSAAERLLKQRGISCTRRWLRVFVKKWGLRE
jgi:DNA-binding NtrC family response regulator